MSVIHLKTKNSARIHLITTYESCEILFQDSYVKVIKGMREDPTNNMLAAEQYAIPFPDLLVFHDLIF